MPKSSGGKGNNRGSTRGRGKGGSGSRAGWPAKTGKLSGKGRDNAPPSGKSKGK